MKNYIVKVVKSDGFDDKEENLIHRTKNDVFNCTRERYEFLKKNNAVVLMGIEKQEDYKKDDIVKELIKQEEIMLEKGAGLSEVMIGNKKVSKEKITINGNKTVDEFVKELKIKK